MQNTRYPSFEIPLSQADLSQEQLSHLAKLGFSYDKEIKRKGRYVYLLLPEDSPFESTIEHDWGGQLPRYVYRLSYGDTELLNVFHVAEILKSRLDLDIKAAAIAQLAAALPKPIPVNDAIFTEDQAKIAKEIRHIIHQAFTFNLLRGYGKTVLDHLQKLKALREPAPQEHDDFVRSVPLFLRVYSYFPEWKDLDEHHVAAFTRMDAGAGFCLWVMNADGNQDADLLSAFLEMRDQGLSQEKASTYSSLTRHYGNPDKPTADTFSIILQNGMVSKSSNGFNRCVELVIATFKKVIEQTPYADFLACMPATYIVAEKTITLAPLNNFICGYYHSGLKGHSQLALTHLLASEKLLPEWQDDARVNRQAVAYLKTRLPKFIKHNQNKLAATEDDQQDKINEKKI